MHDIENHGVEKIITLRTGDSLLQATVPSQTDATISAINAARVPQRAAEAVCSVAD